MITKIGTVNQLHTMTLDPSIYQTILENVTILDNEYGSARNIDRDDGGYVLYCAPGTSAEELRMQFDYTDYLPEYVLPVAGSAPAYCSALFLVSNEFGVVIVISAADAPDEILKEMEVTSL